MNVIYSIHSSVYTQRPHIIVEVLPTFSPYCNLATTGLSEMKVNSFRLMGKGRGRMRPMKTPISKTKRQKT